MGIFFSDIHCEDLAELPEVKLTSVGSPLRLEFLILRLVHTEPPVIHPLQFRFSSPGSFLRRFLLVDFYASKLWFSPFAGLSNLGAVSYPVNSFL